MSLAEELAARVEAGRGRMPPEGRAVYAKTAETLAASDLLERALREGDAAPMFTLPDAYGNPVSLEEILGQGPAIISFYRGSWCPFCNLELRALQRELESVEAAGATLVAISPNRPDVSLDLIEEHGLTFPVLSDHGNAVAKRFNIVYEMIPEHIEYYRQHDRDVGAMNGTEEWELPVPATYVVDRDGIIRYAFVELNHRVRAEPSEVVAAAAALTD